MVLGIEIYSRSSHPFVAHNKFMFGVSERYRVYCTGGACPVEELLLSCNGCVELVLDEPGSRNTSGSFL